MSATPLPSALAPTSPEEVVAVVHELPRVMAVGAGTKANLARVGPEFTRLSTAQLNGILEYQPDEFTVTAGAGIRLDALANALAAQGQYLPFDPLLVDAGATLAGTVASGTNGPGRFRFGGIRDFILGVRAVDGEGRLLRLGGKVVKNAAGFDVPKFLVGSLGRFAVLTEITCKVFPRPTATLTLRLPFETLERACETLPALARGRWELDAMELRPSPAEILLRLAGPEAALPALAAEILRAHSGETLESTAATLVWAELREFQWAFPGGPLIKIPTSLAQLPALARRLQSLTEIRWSVSLGGNVVWLSAPDDELTPALDGMLRELGLTGLDLRGHGPVGLGIQRATSIALAVKQALDPQHRFPPLPFPA